MNQKPFSQIVGSEGAPRTIKESGSSPIRLQKLAKVKLYTLIGGLNRNRVGRKIRADDLIGYSLDLLTEDHLKDLVPRLLTNKERIKILYKQLSKTKRGLSHDDFLGMFLNGKISN
jgi:hypothetical protein